MFLTPLIVTVNSCYMQAVLCIQSKRPNNTHCIMSQGHTHHTSYTGQIYSGFYNITDKMSHFKTSYNPGDPKTMKIVDLFQQNSLNQIWKSRCCQKMKLIIVFGGCELYNCSSTYYPSQLGVLEKLVLSAVKICSLGL